MVPLEVHSAFSLLQGTSGIRELCSHAAELGYRQIALTDTDNLYGLWTFLEECRRHGLRPIVGAVATDVKKPLSAVCLVKNSRGYSNLCRLLTRRCSLPDFDLKSEIPRFSEGLMVLSEYPELLCEAYDAGVDVAAAMKRRPVPASHPLRRAAARLGIPLAAVPASYFNRPEDYAVHRVLRAVDRNTSLSRLKPGAAAPEDAYLAPPGEYERRFAVCPEAVENTMKASEKLCFTGPDFGLVMPPYESDSPEQADRHLREAVYEGARLRYGEVSEAVKKRLEHELQIISGMGFSSYFLVVADIVRNSPRTCGRGSGAASIAAYCLGITNVCPLKHNLYFERFLNPGRRDAPDIDVDFAWDERDAVIFKVLDKYAGRAAMAAAHACFKPRMAFRETARVFGFTEKEIKKGIRHSCRRQEIQSIAERITGLPRYISVHSGGIVITPEPIDSYVPVERARKGVPVLQWDKDGVEEAGLVKIDLLGNRSLGVVRDAAAGVRENGIDFDEDCRVPEEDEAACRAVARGDTMGCFYIESPAMRLLQQKAGRGDFNHLVIHSSIIRPAANDIIQEYLRRLHGGGWKPAHPLMAGVLEETYGLMVFQEDVSRTAVRIAGFSHAEADGLRKVMSKKDRERRLQDYYGMFKEGARKKGVEDEVIEKIWGMIMSFSGYSFCKPHSASYARVSYQAAFLKTHYPAEFMAAVISNQGGFYSTFAYVSEARRMGLEILPPDIERSRIRWTGCNKTLRAGLLSIKALSEDVQQRIVEERERRSFADAFDFFDRVRPDETEARALIFSGALDRFHREKNRTVLLWQFSEWRKKRGCPEAAPSLFSGLSSTPSMPSLPDDDPKKRLRREFAALGFLCSCHPMTLFKEQLKNRRTVKAFEIPRYAGCRVKFAGWLITGKTILTSKGDPMQFVTFEDETGLAETAFFPKAFSRFRRILDAGRPFLLSGRVEENWGAAVLSVDRVEFI